MRGGPRCKTCGELVGAVDDLGRCRRCAGVTGTVDPVPVDDDRLYPRCESCGERRAVSSYQTRSGRTHPRCFTCRRAAAERNDGQARARAVSAEGRTCRRCGDLYPAWDFVDQKGEDRPYCSKCRHQWGRDRRSPNQIARQQPRGEEHTGPAQASRSTA